jgi:hypothetical protein
MLAQCVNFVANITVINYRLSIFIVLPRGVLLATTILR